MTDSGTGGAGGATTDAGPGSIVLLQGGIASLGGVAGTPATVLIYDDGLETGDRVCAGNICVTGAITP
jgi:hypothetical protein